MILTELGIFLERGPFQIFFGNNKFLWPRDQALLAVHRVYHVEQIHSSIALEVNEESLNNTKIPQGDALWSKDFDLGLMVKTADCLPILIATPQNIFAIHAGWKGLASGIIEKALKPLGDPTKALAFVGPHISKCHFEVHLEVAESVQLALPPDKRSSVISPHPDEGKVFLDLGAVSRVQLTMLGIPSENIWVTNECTFRNPDYHSFRRDHGNSGRNYSLIWKSKR